MTSKVAPLKNIRVLDFSRILAGPFCSMLLGDLGAEVWKIEKPKIGDDTRNWKPPSVNGESCYFLCINRNKKSVAVDLKHPKGVSLVKRLAAQSDVLLENFKPGSMQRLGLDYKTLSANNSGLVYCSITGYGQTGPWSTKGGYDVIAEALGGFMHITGPESGEPCKAGVAVVDMLTGLYAHGAIMAALLQKQTTTRGQHIDCNLLSTQIATLINIGSNFLNGGIEGRRWGTAHESIVPYQAFRTEDERFFVVGAGNDEHFIEFCKLMNLEQLIDDQRFTTNSDRVENRQVLIDLLEEKFIEQPLSHWCSLFKDCSFPAAPVNTLEETFSHPQVLHNNMVRAVQHPTAGTLRLTGPAVTFSESENCFRSSPPLLGEHTKQVLHENLYLSDSQIEALKQEGAIDYHEYLI